MMVSGSVGSKLESSGEEWSRACDMGSRGTSAVVMLVVDMVMNRLDFELEVPVNRCGSESTFYGTLK